MIWIVFVVSNSIIQDVQYASNLSTTSSWVCSETTAGLNFSHVAGEVTLLYFLRPSNIVTATAGPKVLHNFKLMIVTSGSRTLVTTDKPRKRGRERFFLKSQQHTWLAGKVCSRWYEMWGRGCLDRGSAQGPSSAIFTTISLYILLVHFSRLWSFGTQLYYN